MVCGACTLNMTNRVKTTPLSPAILSIYPSLSMILAA